MLQICVKTDVVLSDKDKDTEMEIWFDTQNLITIKIDGKDICYADYKGFMAALDVLYDTFKDIATEEE